MQLMPSTQGDELMTQRDGIFEGDNPFELARTWMANAHDSELNDPNAMALATVDADGLPNVRVVLLKDIEEDAFVFYTNYNSVKSQEAFGAGTAAFVLHWKSLRRQIRVRGHVEREDGVKADEYFASRSPLSRLGAWASDQSAPLASREDLMRRVDQVREDKGETSERPSNWGGIRIRPVEIEFWADGDARLHDRFRWTRASQTDKWTITRLNP